MTKCYRGGNKHKFKARYDEKPSPLVKTGFNVEYVNPYDLRKLLINKVYVRDVCEWCGKVIEREENFEK